MKQGYSYETNCVGSTAHAIQSMIDRARSVTLQTIRRHCAELAEFERRMGYDTGSERGGLRLRDDYHVSYFKSVYRGRPCYYVRHSAIEYIWTKGRVSR